jgi:hypothetical protein
MKRRPEDVGETRAAVDVCGPSFPGAGRCRDEYISALCRRNGGGTSIGPMLEIVMDCAAAWPWNLGGRRRSWNGGAEIVSAGSSS